MVEGRSLLKEILQNFWNSLKPIRLSGVLKGKDQYGTEYYEGCKNPHLKKPRRWFSPVNIYEINHQIPNEWEAWLRHKRKDPPTEEEIKLNLQKMKNTIENSKILEMQRSKDIGGTTSSDSTSQKSAFPTYKEYSSFPSYEDERKNSA